MFKPIGVNRSGGFGKTQPTLSMFTTSAEPDIRQAAFGSSFNGLQGNSSGELTSSHIAAPFWSIRTLTNRFDWIIIGACSLTFVWLLFIAGSALIRRRPFTCSRLRSKPTAHNTNWRFNAPAATSEKVVSGPFRQSKVCVNYYGSSNGDSEHDMMQSCSQSSHYEDFVQYQLQLQQRLMNQHQPIYFNANSQSTINRRPLKSSLSTASTGDSSTGSRHGQQHQLQLQPHLQQQQQQQLQLQLQLQLQNQTQPLVKRESFICLG